MMDLISLPALLNTNSQNLPSRLPTANDVVRYGYLDTGTLSFTAPTMAFTDYVVYGK